MAKNIMIQGTASNAGKSIITAGLCRIFAQDGYRVAPFKAQNMALNSFITHDGFEIGMAQAAQAYAAMKEPDVRMNPVLLKPTGDMASQVIINGEVAGNMTAKEYFQFRKTLLPRIVETYNDLARENDIIVIEGAGSPAEINLRSNDIANMGVAKSLSAPVILAGDIDRGGVFASLYGTVMLLEEDERNYIKGLIINKFRGDKNILAPGLTMFRERIDIPFVGVIPFMDINFDAEDSLSGDLLKDNKGYPDIVVIKLPHISNFTDFAPLELIKGVSVRYVSTPEKLGNPDFLIIPGTKNTINDLRWLYNQGFKPVIEKYVLSGKPVMGICGGFQMLTSTISDPFNVEYGGEVEGLSYFNVKTVFKTEKIRQNVSGKISGLTGVFSELNGKQFQGYEIHMGVTEPLKGYPIWNVGNVYGTYVHGIFDDFQVLNVISKSLGSNETVEISGAKSMRDYRNLEYDKIAETFRQNIDMTTIYDIIDKGL